MVVKYSAAAVARPSRPVKFSKHRAAWSAERRRALSEKMRAFWMARKAPAPRERRAAKSKSRSGVNGGAPALAPMLTHVERPVTTEEIAQHLRVTTRTIAEYRANGSIPFWRINARRILYRISDVERALSRNNI